MRNFPRFVLIAPAFALAASWTSPAALAQESMAGVGAASAMGATLGAAAAGGMSAGRATNGMGGRPEGMGVDPAMPGGAPMTTTQTTVTTTRVTTPLAGIANGNQLLGQLMAVPNRPQPTRVRRSAAAQATYSRRVTRLSPTARKKLVLRKYRIAPRGWLASYLPQDRYKFSKAWKYVSTETDRFYYRPQDMSRRRFSPNRVIGFRTWQDAMLAGYRPDPASKPEPGNQFAYFATMTRDEPLVRYLEYAYSGQVSPSSLNATYNYVRRVKAVIDRNPHVRRYQRSTVNAILEASLTGDASLIPTVLGQTAPVVVTATGQPQFPGAGPMNNLGGPPPGFTPPTGPPPGFTPPTGPPPSAFSAGGGKQILGRPSR